MIKIVFANEVYWREYKMRKEGLGQFLRNADVDDQIEKDKFAK